MRGATRSSFSVLRVHKEGIVRAIRITAGKVQATADLNDSVTADAIWNALPIKARANTWGDEIYFSIPVHLEEAADAKAVVEMGDLGYWAPGSALCIFFGPTPVSRGSEIRPASPVNVFGRVKGDATAFKAVPSGASIVIDKLA
jgi:uncharacterized protein